MPPCVQLWNKCLGTWNAGQVAAVPKFDQGLVQSINLSTDSFKVPCSIGTKRGDLPVRPCATIDRSVSVPVNKSPQWRKKTPSASVPVASCTATDSFLTTVLRHTDNRSDWNTHTNTLHTAGCGFLERFWRKSFPALLSLLQHKRQIYLLSGDPKDEHQKKMFQKWLERYYFRAQLRPRCPLVDVWSTPSRPDGGDSGTRSRDLWLLDNSLGHQPKRFQQVQINFRTFSLVGSNGRGVRSTGGQPEDFWWNLFLFQKSSHREFFAFFTHYDLLTRMSRMFKYLRCRFNDNLFTLLTGITLKLNDLG